MLSDSERKIIDAHRQNPNPKSAYPDNVIAFLIGLLDREGLSSFPYENVFICENGHENSADDVSRFDGWCSVCPGKVKL